MGNLGASQLIQFLGYLRGMQVAKIGSTSSPILNELPIDKLTNQFRRNLDATDYMGKIFNDANKVYQQGRYKPAAVICHFGLRVWPWVREQLRQGVNRTNTPRWFQLGRIIVDIKLLKSACWLSEIRSALSNIRSVDQSFTSESSTIDDSTLTDAHELLGEIKEEHLGIMNPQQRAKHHQLRGQVQDFHAIIYELTGSYRYQSAARHYYIALKIANDLEYVQSLREVETRTEYRPID